MTDPIKINLPKLGESIVSATVVQWFKNVGDKVELDEPLLEVSTDKINSEIPSPAAGILQEIFAQPSQEMQVGETLALLSGLGTGPARAALPPAEAYCAREGFLNLGASETKPNRSEAVRPASPGAPKQCIVFGDGAKEISEGNISEDCGIEKKGPRMDRFSRGADRFGEVAARPNFKKPTARSINCAAVPDGFLSPSVLRLLKEKGLKLEEVDRIPRTGEGGRLTKKDVEDYVPAIHSLPLPPPQSDESERVKMSSLRKAIAENMVRSFYEAPHASLVTEVDVTRIVKLIQDQKAQFFQKHGAKISVTAFVARAMARALKAFPLLNSSLDGDTIVMQKFVNLGIAVSVEQGVMVPVIRGCQRLNLPEIAQQIAKMAEKARAGRLEANETRQGTITMTNFGMTGTMIGVPIIRFPEVAIVGLGAITKKVVAMPDDSIAIRSMMWISLTFDHRVLDGIYGCGFLGELKKHLEEDVSLD